MKILIWDDKGNRCAKNKQVLADAAEKVSISADIEVWAQPLAPRATDLISNKFNLLLLHGANAEIARGWLLENRITNNFILEYGGDAISDGIPRSVTRDNPLKEWEAKGILYAAANAISEKDFKARVAAVWARNVEVVLALRLLCEAWLLNCDGVHLEKEVSLSKTHITTMITAPISPDDWFDPFMKGFKGQDCLQKASTATKVASYISEQIENCRTDVETLLNELVGLYSTDVPGAVTRCKFEKTIKHLSEKLQFQPIR
jgi:hypothetical protein